ncbi:MAG: aminotransferase class III-fold pyridoxal phosphate-dependent enzyme, partial [Deltaproteobacteria bacterium]|nr:aminotransferase class III-fold pyridoxal phosphate-dependent enzyme [Deltaproteobacteria bacterium]
TERAMGRDTAAVIVEPIQGNAGVNIPPSGYLRGLRELCTKSGALLIFDEVQTGIGRTGRWFAYQHEGVTPDLMTLAKAVGGGLPLGALIVTEEVAQALKPGTHASTFGGNPVACAAGLTTLAVIERDRLVDNAAAMGERLVQGLRALSGRSAAVAAVRGRGLMVGIELDRPAKPVLAQCRELGLLATAAGDTVVRLLPPLVVTPGEVDQAVEILASALG